MEAAHYCKYAEAIYGWPLYLNTNILRAPTVGALVASARRLRVTGLADDLETARAYAVGQSPAPAVVP